MAILAKTQKWYEGKSERGGGVCNNPPPPPLLREMVKWNARVLRTGGSGQNGPAHGSEPPSSPAPVGQSAGIRRVVKGKMCARALDLSIWPEPVVFGLPERTNGKQPKIKSEWFLER